jgi:[NiFe] hydrogenase assembly HybE family chaperone
VPEVARRLEIAFERIARTRMADMPFVNPALQVEAVGFRAWQGQWLGVLVTPWSINVLLLPRSADWPRLATGAERFVELPAGRFRFVAGFDPALGEYHACSLFSPALEFSDHAAARTAAEAALAAILDPATALAGQSRSRKFSRRDFLRVRPSEEPDGS